MVQLLKTLQLLLCATAISAWAAPLKMSFAPAQRITFAPPGWDDSDRANCVDCYYGGTCHDHLREGGEYGGGGSSSGKPCGTAICNKGGICDMPVPQGFGMVPCKSDWKNCTQDGKTVTCECKGESDSKHVHTVETRLK